MLPRLRKFKISRFELRLCDRIPHNQIVGDKVGRCRAGDFRQALKPPRLPGVVGVKQGDPVRFRLAQTGISRSRRAAIGGG